MWNYQKMQYFSKNYYHLYSKLKSTLKYLGVKDDSQISWSKILKNQKKKIFQEHKKNYKNKTVLIATNVGGQRFAVNIEALISIALYLKGYDVEYILCDGVLKACLMAQHNYLSEDENLNSGMKKICKSCFSHGDSVFSETGFKINYLSEYLTKKDIEQNNLLARKLSFDEMTKFEIDGIKIGIHSYSNLLRFYGAGEVEINHASTEILRNFIVSSLITKKSIENLLSQKKIYKVFLHHAIYVPQGIIAEVAKKKGIDYTSWVQAYKNKSLEIAKNNNWASRNIFETNTPWINSDLEKKSELNLLDYFENKKKFKSNDWLSFNSKKRNDFVLEFIKKFKLIDKSKNVCIYTNLIWDAQIIYPNPIFKNMMDWVYSTVEYFSNRPDLNLIIRVHPGEIKSGYISKERVYHSLKKKFKNLKRNIYVLDSSSEINSYLLADYCDLNIVYSSRISYELSAMGHNVIVAGSAFCSNKNITLDPKSKNEYFTLLNSFPNNLKPISFERKINALKYANYYLNEVCVELSSININKEKWPPFNFNDNLIEILLNEKDNGIKKILKFILN